MKLDNLLIQIILFSFPGILAFFIYEQATGKKQKDSKFYFINIIILSFLSYLIFFIITGIIDIFYKTFTSDFSFFVQNFFAKGTISAFYEHYIDFFIFLFLIFLSTSIVTFLIITADYNNWIFWILKKLNISDRENDYDVWYSLLGQNKADWIYVRDYKINLFYRGQVRRFSESEKIRELHLVNVTVYNEKSEELYKMKEIYISRDSQDLGIEIYN